MGWLSFAILNIIGQFMNKLKKNPKDNRLLEVQTMWDEHTKRAFPEILDYDLKPDLVLIDSTIAGLVLTFLKNGSSLNKEQLKILNSTLVDLKKMLAKMEVNYMKEFFQQLFEMGEKIKYDNKPPNLITNFS